MARGVVHSLELQRRSSCRRQQLDFALSTEALGNPRVGPLRATGLVGARDPNPSAPMALCSIRASAQLGVPPWHEQ